MVSLFYFRIILKWYLIHLKPNTIFFYLSLYLLSRERMKLSGILHRHSNLESYLIVDHLTFLPKDKKYVAKIKKKIYLDMKGAKNNNRTLQFSTRNSDKIWRKNTYFVPYDHDGLLEPKKVHLVSHIHCISIWYKVLILYTCWPMYSGTLILCTELFDRLKKCVLFDVRIKSGTPFVFLYYPLPQLFKIMTCGITRKTQHRPRLRSLCVYIFSIFAHICTRFETEDKSFSSSFWLKLVQINIFRSTMYVYYIFFLLCDTS